MEMKAIRIEFAIINLSNMGWLFISKEYSKEQKLTIYKLKILHIGPVKNKKINITKKEQIEIVDGIGSDGPSRSILGLADGLRGLGVDVGFLSSKDFDYKSKSLPKGENILNHLLGKNTTILQIQKMDILH